MRVLGVDVGSRRVGVAISDPAASFAVPYRVIDDPDMRRSARTVAEIARGEEVGVVVIGLPLTMEGRERSAAAAARSYGSFLAEHIDVDLVYFDERLSTVEATTALRETGITSRIARGRVDAHAAAVILQGYLDQEMGRTTT
jgi:putative Holliday junction resolvase